MIIRKVHPDMPTTTVALELLSRVGSPRKYSLSPFAGYSGERFRVAGYSDFRSDASFDGLIRLKDTFTFYHGNIYYTHEQKEQDITDIGLFEDDDDEDDGSGVVIEEASAEESSHDKYRPGDKVGPKYVRRFEDYTDTARISKFLFTVVSNSIKNNVGYNKKRDMVAETIKGGDDDEEVNVNELVVEDMHDIGEYSMQRRSREILIRSMYRLNLLSRETGINVVSVLLSFCRFRYIQSSKVLGKPKFLVDNGPVYTASSRTGDCVAVLQNPNDRALTRVRDVIWPVQYVTNKLAEEFYGDCQDFIQCVTNLNINTRACDARKYTHDWINYYSRKILINNYAYVCRKVGGYSMNVLHALQNMSLDAAMNDVTEEEVDTYTRVLNMIDTIIDLPAHEFPPGVYHDLRQSTSHRTISTCVDIATLLVSAEQRSKDKFEPQVVTQVTEVFSASTSNEGFILTENSKELYKLRVDRLLPK
ncbi:MAG: hypothetical protein NC131_16965, partial [Roseburia sp.]|nr:hypothetical protein [Roseburia sp.]